MPNVPQAIQMADEAWQAVREGVSNIRNRLLVDACRHRGAVKLANDTFDDPSGVMAADGRASGLISTFRVTVEGAGEKVEKDFTVVYSPASQCFYMVSPSKESEDQIISGDENIQRLPEIVRSHFYADIVRLMETTDAVKGELAVSVGAVKEAGFGRPVMVELVGLGRNNELGERVLSTQPIEDYNAELKRALAARP